MERGEIWLVSLDPTAGHEQQGTRPVLIVTPAAFNRVTRLPVVVPVTSGGNFARTAGFAVSLDGVGIRTTALVQRKLLISSVLPAPRFIKFLKTKGPRDTPIFIG